MTRIAKKAKSNNQKNSKRAAKLVASRSAKSTRRSNAQMPEPGVSTSSPARALSKREQLAALLVRDEGATLDQMIAATNWLPHTTRAAMSGLRKAGYAIDSDKIDGVRTYRAVAPK